eukprot:6437439-Pyramimonas_sp.AAC.1
MSVVCQVPRGQKQDAVAGRDLVPLRVLIAVQCNDSMLEISGPKSEGPAQQARVLRNSVRKEGAEKVQMVCAGFLSALDQRSQLRAVFPSLKRASKDLLRTALEVEQ